MSLIHLSLSLLSLSLSLLPRYGIVFNIVLVMGFKATASNDAVFRERKVFEMQRTKRYYSTLPYCIAGECMCVHVWVGGCICVSLFVFHCLWRVCD